MARKPQAWRFCFGVIVRGVEAGGVIHAVRRQVCKNTVIPAQAGIQTEDVNPVFLDSGLRRNDGKTKLGDGLVERPDDMALQSQMTCVRIKFNICSTRTLFLTNEDHKTDR
jgi:hypothetical protein